MNVRHEFFDTIGTEQQAYWLGFVLADGSVSTRPHYRLTVGLQGGDSEHLASLECALGGSRPPQPDREGVRLSWYSRHLVEALMFHRVLPAKSRVADLVVPLITGELERHFWRGVFDGDGMLTVQRKPGVAAPEYRLSLCGARSVVAAFLHWAVVTAGVGRQAVVPASNQHGDSRAWKFEMSGNRQIAALASHLYEDSTVSLPRKRRAYEALVAQNGGGSYRIDRYTPYLAPALA